METRPAKNSRQQLAAVRTERSNLTIFSLCLLLTLLGFYLPWLSGGQSYYLSDLTYYYEPFLRFIGSALKENRLPIWNPYLYCGMPQIAVPAPGIYYPGNWLFAFMPFSAALAAFMVIHQWAAGVGAYLLIAGLGWGAFAAATGGITLALCGYMFSLQKNFSLVASAAWLPLIIWSLRKIGPGVYASHYVQVIVGALAVFMLLSSGRPEISLPCFLLVLAYIAQAAYGSCVQDRLGRIAVKTALWRITSVALGILLAMPVILPALEWTALSPRSHGLSQSEALVWSTNWYDCLCLILSQPLGDLNLLGSKFLTLVATRTGYIPYFSSALVGPVVITLSIWGAFDRRWKVRWLVFLVFAAGMVATLGDRTPILPALLHQFPLLGAFRYPVKLIILPVWCLILLAARGAFISVSTKPDLPARLAAWIFWAIFGIVMTVLATTPALGWIAPHLRMLALPPVDLSVISAGLVAIGNSGLAATGVGLACCLAGELYHRDKLPRKAFAAALLSALAASLLVCAFQYSRQGTDSQFFQQDSQLAASVKHLATIEKAGKLFRVLPLYFDPLTAPSSNGSASREETSARFYQYGRQLLLPNTNMDFGLPSSFGYEAAETSDYRQIFGAAHQAYLARCNSKGANGSTNQTSLVPLARFCQATATRYIFTQIYQNTGTIRELPTLDSALFTLAVENKEQNFRIYRLNKPMPRAYLAGNWRWCDTHDQAIAEMKSTDAGGLSPADCVLLEHKDFYATQYEPKIPPPGNDALKSSWLAFMQNEPEHVSLSISNATSCFVVLSDHFYPGWHAKVDRMPAELYRANAVVRAVFLRPGSHLVEFDYDPDSLYDGQKLATAAMIVIAILVGIAVFIKLAESVRPKPEE